MSDKPKERFLVVDDSSHFSFFIKRTLEERFSAQVKVAWDCASAREVFAREKFDVITLDYVLPDGDGLELLQEFTSEEYCPPIIMITGEGDENVAARCLHLGASGYVAKSRDFYARLSEVVDKVRGEVAKRKVHEKLKKSSVVLHAIENIEQLVASEKDRESFLRGICGNLLEGRDYYNAWITLLDDSGDIKNNVGSTMGEKYVPIMDILNEGTLTVCCKRALGQPGVMIMKASSEECEQCPLAMVSRDIGVMVARLKHGDNVYGLLGAYGPVSITEDKEEADVITQVAEDTAYALGVIEIAMERKKAEDALKEQDRRLRAIADTVRESIMILSQNDKIVYWNAGAERMYGYPASEAIGKEPADILFIGKDRIANSDRFMLHVKGAAHGSTGGVEEFEVTNKDGAKIHVSFSITYFSVGETAYVVVVGRNISDHKRVLDVLSKSEGRYRRLFESFSEGIAALTEEGKVLECNHSFASILEYKPEELIDLHLSDLVAAKWLGRSGEMFDSLTDNDFTGEFELEMMKHEGKPAQVMAKMFRADDEDDRVYGWVVITDKAGAVSKV
ncbi:MAG: PAS domain S-box protein [Actinobacteria bacterium]|nr:PAS domain S-box protein [Actinomycetota bacterium]